MKINVLKKYGLTGNTGLGVHGFFHISANYAAGKGYVFIDWGEGWKRVKKEMALKKKMPIVRCYHCKRPAISIDHHYPYMNDMNYCERHQQRNRTWFVKKDGGVK